MKTEEFKDVLLQVLELQLEYQLRAIRELRGKPQPEPVSAPRRGRRRQSLVDLSVQILTDRPETDVLPTRTPSPVLLLKKHAVAYCFAKVLRLPLLS